MSTSLTATVPAGGGLTLTVQASGNETLEYQWKKDGVILHGVTGASLSLTALESVDSGAYVVINEVGLSRTLLLLMSCNQFL